MTITHRFTPFAARGAALTGFVLSLASPSCAQTAPLAKPKLNVLFIAVDDLNTDLGCYGRSDVKSPNIDALASRGMVFLRAYCQQAVCSPSRTSLLTGRYPDTTRIYDLKSHFRSVLPNVITLPQQFKQNGYFTQEFGKVFHGGLDDPRSWNVMANGKVQPQKASATGGRNGAGQEQGKGGQHVNLQLPATLNFVPNNFAPANFQPANGFGAPVQLIAAGGATAGGATAGGATAGEPDGTKAPAKVRGGSWGAPDVADNALSDGQEADRAITALGQLQSKPFFLAVGFHKPHLPYIAPKKYFDLYPPASVKLPDNMFRTKDAPQMAFTDSGELRSYSDIPKGHAPIPLDKARELIRAYRASTSYVDAQIGRVLSELDRLKLRDNTMVILWGDHGYQLGEHLLWVKHTNFEVATHVPLIISYPGQTTRGAKTKALVEFVDVYPTLCELAGLPLTPGLEGKSLVPILKNPQLPGKAVALSQYPRGSARHMGYTMRTDRYRFTQWIKADDKRVAATELYDHQIDPEENVNVAARPENQALIAQLATQLRQSFPALTAPGPLPMLSVPKPRMRGGGGED